MIKLIRLSDREFIVQKISTGIRCEGSRQEAEEMLWILGVEPDEIQLAMKELVNKDADIADFDINNMLTYTRQQDRAA